MVDIDTTGEETLHQVLRWLADRNVTVAVSRANQPTAALLAHYHLLKLIGENRLYPTNRHAVAAFCREAGQATPETTKELKEEKSWIRKEPPVEGDVQY
jgi:hypothetical protein